MRFAVLPSGGEACTSARVQQITQIDAQDVEQGFAGTVAGPGDGRRHGRAYEPQSLHADHGTVRHPPVPACGSELLEAPG